MKNRNIWFIKRFRQCSKRKWAIEPKAIIYSFRDISVKIQNASGNYLKDEGDLNAWVEKVYVADGNDQLIDVVLNLRPAFGWQLYFKP